MAKNLFASSPYELDTEFSDTPVEKPSAPAKRGITPSSDDVVKRATELGVDPQLALSIWQQESSSGRNPSTSSKGARGGFQVIPETYQSMMGTSAGQDDAFQNMEAGLRYLAHGQRVIGSRDPELLASGYHAGFGRRELKEGRIPDANDGSISTADYARSVAARARGSRFPNSQKQAVPEDTEFSDTPVTPKSKGVDTEFSDTPPQLDGPSEDAKTPERTWAQAINDSDAVVGKSMANSVKMVTDIFGTDNSASKWLENYAKEQEARFSPAYQAEIKKQGKEKSDLGEDATWGSRAWLTANQLVRNPGMTVSEAVGMVVPQMAMGVAGAASKAPMAAQIGLGTIQGAGAIKGGIADTVTGAPDQELMQDPDYATMRKNGMNEQQAKEVLATTLQSYEKSYGKIALGAGIGALVSKFGSFEKAVANIGKEGAKAGGDGLLKSVGKEVVTEIPQEMTETALGNAGAASGGANIRLDQGVPEAGTAAGIQAGLAGGGAHVISPRRPEQASAPKIDPTAAEPVAPVAPVAPSGPLTGAVEKAAGKVTEHIGDDGKVYETITGPNGVQIIEKATAPLTDALNAAAEDHVIEPAPVAEAPVVAPAPVVEEAKPAQESFAETPPEAKTPALSEMDEPALRERLKYIAGQAKTNGGWNKMLMEQRNAVEKEINARAPKVETPKVEKPVVKKSLTTEPVVQATPAQETAAALPKELAGAKPRYNYGKKTFELNFASDVDRAAYIAAQATPSKRDAEYLGFAMSATGMSEAEVRAHGAQVREAIKAMAKDGKPGTLKVPEVARGVKVEKTPAPKAETALEAKPEFAQEGNVQSRQTLMKSEAGKRAQELEADGKSAGDDPLVRALDAIYNPLQANDKEAQLHALNYGEQNNRSDIAAEAKANLTKLADKLEREAESDTTTPAVSETSPKYQKIKADLETRKAKKGTDAAEIRSRLAGKKIEPKAAPTPAAPAKLTKMTKADEEHLFGTDKKRAAAMDRIAKGTAYFGTTEKANDFIAKNGLKDTHEVVQTGKVRFEVKAKEQTNVTNERTSGQPASPKAVVEKADAGQAAPAPVQPDAPTQEVIDPESAKKRADQIIAAMANAVRKKANVKFEKKGDVYEISSAGVPLGTMAKRPTSAEDALVPAAQEYMKLLRETGQTLPPVSEMTRDQFVAIKGLSRQVDGFEFSGAEFDSILNVSAGGVGFEVNFDGMYDSMQKQMAEGAKALEAPKPTTLAERRAKAKQKDEGQNDELDAEMRSYEAKAEAQAPSPNVAFIKALEEARKELPAGFGIQPNGESISLMENNRYAVNGLPRTPTGVQEALRLAKERDAASKADTKAAQPTDKLAELESLRLQLEGQLEDQGMVRNARTASKLREVEASIEEIKNPDILNALDGNGALAKSVRMELEFKSESTSSESVVRRVLKNKGISPEYVDSMTNKVLAAIGDKPVEMSADDAAKEKAKQDLEAALGDLSMILTKNTRMNITPEQEQALLPVLTRVMDAAFRLGYHKFKDAAKFVVETVSARLGKDVADQITIDHLQGSYIGMAGKYEGASTKREVIDVETLAELNDQPIQEIQNDTKRDDADYVEPLDNELPQGNPELAEDVAAAPSASVRDPDADGNGRTDRDGSKRRTGVGRGEKPILHGSPSEIRAVENGPVNRTDDSPNQLKGGGEGNYQITEEDAIGEGSKGEKLRKNMAAIRTLRQIQKENRAATREEKSTMAKFVGWGGLRELIDPNTKGKQWLDARAELLGTNGNAPLLVDGAKGEEWMALQRSTTAAHFTASEVVSSMWDVVVHFGFKGGRALEPTPGIGNFIGLQPEHLQGATEWHGAELDLITGQMAKLIYPEAAIHAGVGFQDVPFAKGAFDLAKGNPPFGSLVIKSNLAAYSHIPPMKIHNYIIAKAGEHLRPGGIMDMVVTHRFLDTANPEAREHLAKNFRFLGAFRLPNDAFAKNAGTQVVTDVIFLQKLREGEKATDLSWLDIDGKITVDGQEIRVNKYYENNPNNILGRSAMDGSMYGGRGEGEYTVHSDGRDLKQAIKGLIDGPFASLKDIAKPTNADLDVQAAVMLEQSDLPIGGVVLREDGKIIKREMDDSAGNAVVVEVTPETLWKDGAEKWLEISKAAKALRDGKNIEQSGKAFIEAASIAYSAKGDKRPKPTKAEQAVYDIRDSLDAPTYAWAHNAQLQEIETTLNRKKLGAESHQSLQGLLKLRNTTLELIKAEMSDAKNMETVRKRLNKEYEAYVTRHGYISDPSNSNLLDGDVGVESGLESGFKPKNGKAKASASKADIFTKRVNFPYKEVTSAENTRDGLQVSMSERGRLDIEYIAKLTGKSAVDVIEELSTGENPAIFFDPATNEYTDADGYLSGNVKKKLEQAQANGLKANVKALTAVQPKPKVREQIKPNVRGSWMPEEVFEQFLADMGVKSPRVNIIASQGMILASGGGMQENEFGSQFKSPHKSVEEIFNAAASGKAVTIWNTQSDGTRVKNDTATKDVNLLVERMASVFEEWAYASDERAGKIVDAFNEKMNTHVPRKYDGNKYLKTVGASPSINLRTTQKNAAWRMVQAPTVLLDHVVGAGKTFTVITGVKERKRLGLSRKPMVVVPNHLVTQWAKDFYALYPGAKILAATPDDFAKPKRRRLFSRIATGDFDAVIIGHSSLSFIPSPLADEQRIINENITELQDVLNEMKSKKESGRTLTQIQERLQKYKDKLDDLQKVRRDEIGIDLESMGIDYVAVDEMHEFKNLEYSSAGERVVGMNDPKGSKKAFDLYTKLRGVISRGGAVTGATGTPVSNSLVELYTMMKYLAHKDLTERNQINFDAWSGAYARTENKLEYTATQKLKPRRVLAGLNNLTALKQVYESFADVISMDDLKRIYADDVKAKNKKNGTKERTDFPVPKVEGGKRQLDSGQITSSQSLYMDYLVARMQAIESNKSNKEYAKIDNPLYVLTDARKMSLDIRIVDPTAPRDSSGKVMRAADNIKALYDKWDADKGAQMVFCDLSTPAKTAAKEAKSLIRDSMEMIFGKTDAKRLKPRVEAQGEYIKQWRYIESLAEEVIESTKTDPEVADKIAAYLAGLEDVEAVMTTADVGFSVYDDLRAVLVEKGIPEREVAFIHDYNTPEQKAKLFQAVNDGDIRVLIGSSAKMGAGTNAQKRLVGLHHMDAPWRPSDVEQREGRIIRQGNDLYKRDPDGFEVSITAYSTNGTSDAVMWQVLERKAKAIEEFRSTEMDSTDEEEGDANQYAEFMAQSTGNPVFKLKLEAEREADLLDADTRGIVLAKTQAKRFLETYERDMAQAKATMSMVASANFDTIKVGKEGGTAKEFNDVMAAVEKRYNDDYAKFLVKKEEANKALDAYLATPEDKRGDKPKMPTAPSKAGPLSKSVQEGSGYARAIHQGLAFGTMTGLHEFELGNVKMRVRKSQVHETFWFLDINDGTTWVSYESADATAAENSPKLAFAMTPDALNAKLDSLEKGAKWKAQNLSSQLEIKKTLANKEVDNSKLDEARKVAEWFKTQVAFAEQQADEQRGQRMNQYISGDRKRPLKQFSTEKKPERSIDYDGITYNVTGYTSGNYAQATDDKGKEVIIQMNGDTIERVIEKPKGVSYSGVKPSAPPTTGVLFSRSTEADQKAMERLFKGLDGLGITKKQALSEIESRPEAAAMNYVEDNYFDILGELDDSGRVIIKC